LYIVLLNKLRFD